MWIAVPILPTAVSLATTETELAPRLAPAAWNHGLLLKPSRAAAAVLYKYTIQRSNHR